MEQNNWASKRIKISVIDVFIKKFSEFLMKFYNLLDRLQYNGF